MGGEAVVCSSRSPLLCLGVRDREEGAGSVQGPGSAMGGRGAVLCERSGGGRSLGEYS